MQKWVILHFCLIVNVVCMRERERERVRKGKDEMECGDGLKT